MKDGALFGEKSEMGRMEKYFFVWPSKGLLTLFI